MSGLKTVKKVTSFKGLIKEEFEEVQAGDINYWKENDTDVYEKIIQNMKEIALDDDWWDFIYEGFQEDMNKKFGWAPETDDMNFSGFYSQGDGASFTGTLYQDDVAGIMKKIYKKFPLNKGFEDGNIDVQIDIERHGRYVHEKSVSVEISHLDSVDYEEFFDLYEKELQAGELKGVDEYDADECDDAIYDYIDGYVNELEDTLNEWLEDSCIELYKRLESAYEDMTSDEAMEEMALNNDYQFDEDGNIVG